MLTKLIWGEDLFLNLIKTTNRNTGQLFRPYYVSSAVHTTISTTGDQTSDHRLQSRNSTTDSPVHITHK